MSRGGKNKRPQRENDQSRPDPRAARRAAASRWSPRARTRLLRAAGIVIAIAAAVTVAWRTFRYALPGPLGSATMPAPREAAPVSRFAPSDFVGAERCATCHAAEFAKWQASVHGRAGGPASPDVVIAAFNGNPIRFRDAVVTPRVQAGAYEFVITRDDDSTQVVHVDGVIGRGHMEGGGTQGFVTKRPDGTMRFVPFDWSRHGNNWFCNTNSRAGRGWVPITESMRLSDCGDWPPARVLGDVPRWANCQSCHASQLRVTQTDAGRTTTFTSLAINCESCHGPAKRHVELAERGALANRADVGLVSLRTLDKQASVRVCYQCHSVKDQLREGYVSGDSLELFYSLKLPMLGDRPLHADGRVRTFAYQEAHSSSDCYINGGMTCTSCHDPHTQSYRTVSGDAIPGRNDNRQCTSCHASKAEQVVEHTHHAASSAGSKCTACHMPYLQQPETTDPKTGRAAVRYARSDHSIAIPRPRADSTLGVATACASCHTAKSTAQLEGEAKAWWGRGKPPAREMLGQLTVNRDQRAYERTPLVIDGGPAEPLQRMRRLLLSYDSIGPRRNVAAMAAGVARYLESIPAPDTTRIENDERRRLELLSKDPDLDIRALALASLHLIGRNEPVVRRQLASAAAREGSHDFALRSRWSVALGFMGDKYAERGDYPAARIAYQRGLEVAPGNPRLLQSLGNVERAAGDYRAAITSYEGALARDPRNALTMVNLGIALGAAGDSTAGEEALRRATDADASEPLGWFNLANVTLLKGDFTNAVRYFDRAVALDGALVQAHFQLARIHLLQRDNASALRELRRGLAIDSSDAMARAMARELKRQDLPKSR